jgi:cyclophilin family peptidyl-prolyl cis-trans isomerase
MANRGPNTNTSQFFIMLSDVPSMPKNYTIFGKVVKGLDVVDAIGQVEITPQMGQTDGKPKVDVVMKKVTIRREGGEKSPEQKGKKGA